MTFITADLLMNLQARLYFCSYCGSWVMLQIVLKRKFCIKRPLSHQLPYLKLLFKMHTLYYTDVQNTIKYSIKSLYKKKKKSFRPERPLGVYPALTSQHSKRIMTLAKQWTSRIYKFLIKYRLNQHHRKFELVKNVSYLTN